MPGQERKALPQCFGECDLASIARTLIIHAEPLQRILARRKTLEIRSRPTRIVGQRIGLSEKGSNRILGVCRIDRCLGPLTFRQVLTNRRAMGVDESEFRADRAWWIRKCAEGKIYAWVVRDVWKLRKPVRFRTPSGAVTWARVTPSASSRVANSM
jgi:hypothetical protein